MTKAQFYIYYNKKDYLYYFYIAQVKQIWT